MPGSGGSCTGGVGAGGAAAPRLMFGAHAGGTSGGMHGIGTLGTDGTPGAGPTFGTGGTFTDGGLTGTAPPTPGACGAAGAGSFGTAGSFGVGTGSDGDGGSFGAGSLRWLAIFLAVSEFGSSNFVMSGIVMPGWFGPRYEPHSVASDGSFSSASTSA